MALYPVIHRIEGLKELEGALKVLREQVGVKTGGVIIRGLRAGAKLIRDDARRRAPTIDPFSFVREAQSGLRTRKGRVKKMRLDLIRRNIVEHAIPTASRLAAGKPTVIVRVRNRGYTRNSSGSIRFNNPGTSPGYWWWVEFGTSRTPARPFLRPAFESQKTAALEAFKAHVRKEVDELFQKHFGSMRRAA